MRTLLTIAVLAVVSAGGAALYGRYAGSTTGTSFRTAEVKRDNLLISVGATGTLQPEEVVDIGAQVVGRIKELGKDLRANTDPAFKDKHVDFGSTVEKGMLLAKIDPAVYQAQFNQAEAAVLRAEADLAQMKAKLEQAQAEWIRAQKLRELKLPSLSPTGSKPSAVPIRGISDADFILAKANYEVAQANVDVAAATIAQQKSAMQLAQTNLDYTVIKSPLNGTVIERRVNVGQTVVTNMSAASLFLIAEDLRRMQVWAAVNEADIGRLKTGMPVSFTVDAFPEDVFRGEVSQIRLNAQMTQNVVIYTVVITTDNPDLKLLPYLTANVKFEIEERKDVLQVPNSALRYQPKPEQIVSSAKEQIDPEDSGGKAIGGKRRGKDRDDSSDRTGTLWIQQGEFVSPIEVQIGANDGVFTEVSGDELKEGLEVVVGEKRKEVGSSDVNNPFAPPRFRGRPKS